MTFSFLRCVSVSIAFLAPAALAGCTSDSDPGEESTGGATGGTTATGGAGGATGGMTATGGTTSTASCTAPPADNVIADFTLGARPDVLICEDDPEMHWCWGQWPSLIMGAYAYPDALGVDEPADTCGTMGSQGVMTVDMDGEAMVVSGTVGTWSGGGAWVAAEAGNCIDASSKSGISFTISGDTGTLRTFLRVPVAVVPEGDPVPVAEADITVTSTPTTVEVPWSAFTGGDSSINGGAVVGGFEWGLEWECGGDAFPATMTIDDVMFMP